MLPEVLGGLTLVGPWGIVLPKAPKEIHSSGGTVPSTLVSEVVVCVRVSFWGVVR